MKTKILLAVLAGSVLLAACSGNRPSSSADSVEREAIDSPKIIKTADMRFKVKDVQKAAEQISKLTIESGGMVIHHDLQTTILEKRDIAMPNDSVKKLTVFSTTADLVLKVPSEYAELFMDSLNRLSIFVDQRKLEIEDRTLNYLSEKLKVQNREASVKLRSKVKLTQHVADSILFLKDDVVDRKISNLRTNDAAKFSTLTLTLYQNKAVSKEVVASDDLSDYNTPLSTRLGMALANGWNFFAQMVIGLLNLWAFMIAGAVVWGGIVLYRRRKTAVSKTSA